jgi:hypothetical protein
MNSQGKLITLEEFFLDIGKQMLETSYTLNLGQLLKIAAKLKKYFGQKLKPKKIQNVSKVTKETSWFFSTKSKDNCYSNK